MVDDQRAETGDGQPDDELFYVRGRPYARSWERSRTWAAEANQVLRELGFASADLMALPGTDVEGRPVLRWRGDDWALLCALCMLRKGGGAASVCESLAACVEERPSARGVA
jgi:hypothetical protein